MCCFLYPSPLHIHVRRWNPGWRDMWHVPPKLIGAWSLNHTVLSSLAAILLLTRRFVLYTAESKHPKFRTLIIFQGSLHVVRYRDVIRIYVSTLKKACCLSTKLVGQRKTTLDPPVDLHHLGTCDILKVRNSWCTSFSYLILPTLGVLTSSFRKLQFERDKEDVFVTACIDVARVISFGPDSISHSSRGETSRRWPDGIKCSWSSAISMFEKCVWCFVSL